MNQERKIYPVSAINRYVKRVFTSNPYLNGLWVSGEISNFKHHSSGTLYFTLKDEFASISCVVYSRDVYRLTYMPKDGDKVLAYGSVSLYEKTGAYQLYVTQMESVGSGRLYEEFEKLKKRLLEEGLFDEAHKKPLPSFPRKIGIVTSPTGAVVHDIEEVGRRRYPGVKLVLYPALVQGPEAAQTIVRGIKVLDAIEDVDVIIVGRGGGSLEDLWPFNEEMVARAIYDAKTPIVSAVGHETDVTISDFASDKRAPTPSAAAELTVPDAAKLKEDVKGLRLRQKTALVNSVRRLGDALAVQKTKLLKNAPTQRVREYGMRLDQLLDLRTHAMKQCVMEKKMALDKQKARLEMASPTLPLEKGYAMLMNAEGSVVTSAAALKKGDAVKARLKDGVVKADVTGVVLSAKEEENGE